MDYNVSKELNKGLAAEKLSTNQRIIENSYSEKGLASIKEGQQITGTVVSVGDQVTLNFSGQKVTASKNVLKNAVPGEVKTFEVVKATPKEIELKPVEGDTVSRASFKAVMVSEADPGTILAQKEKAVQKSVKEAEYNETREMLSQIGNTLTELDCKALEKEGFPVEAFIVSGLYHALTRVKTEIAQEAQIARKDQEESQANEINDVRSDLGAVNEINNKVAKATNHITEIVSGKLAKANLPATDENVSQITNALELGKSVRGLDEKAMQYLIANEEEPSVKNIYKAGYSVTAQNPVRLSDQAWGELKGQVSEVIQSAGYEVTEENMAAARWLIENKLPMTTETFSYKKELEELKGSYQEAAVLDKLVEGLKRGINPVDMPLIDAKVTTPEQIVADIGAIKPEALTQAVKSGSELTIRNLHTIQINLNALSSSESLNRLIGSAEVQSIPETITADQAETIDNHQDIAETSGIDEEYIRDTGADTSDSGQDTDARSGSGDRSAAYQEIHARRQLEEIRLKMTLEAAGALEKKGFTVETQRLEKVVEALRELEDQYYKQYLKEADAVVNESNLQILKDTTGSIEQLKQIPSYILGTTLGSMRTQTIPGLLSEGMQLQAQLMKAGTAYETLMTVPNSEYGDSIKKAFANMDSLLSEMNIDNTAENQRAVRILSYNQMAISEDRVNQVKAYDLEVTTMIRNLHPEVTVRMIREGINPLDMPIHELNQTIDKIKEEQGITSEEKYSTYLRQLEKADAITPEERKKYIGIYRLLYNVEKSDGAALGAVVKAGREVTLDHLLTAVQTGKKGRLDAIVNDEFGALQSLTSSKESIAEQLSGFSSGSGQQDGNRRFEKEEAAAEQEEYLGRILRQIKDELTPEGLRSAGTSISQAAVVTATLSTMAQGAGSALVNQGIWETIKDVPVENLMKHLQNMNAGNAVDDDIYAQKVQEIRELSRTSEQAIRFLNDYQVPTTATNIMIANQVLNNGESPIKRLLKLQKENIVEKSENSLKEMNDLTDTLSDKHSMEAVYSQLETDAGAALNRSYSEDKIDILKLTELKNIGQQMTFIKRLAEKEYYQIPVETENGVTNMNLTILRGTKDSGRVSVTIWSEQLGNVKADFSLKDKALKGLIISDSRSGLEQLQKNTDQVEAAAKESLVTIKQLDFSYQRRDMDTYSYLNPDFGESSSSVKEDTERTLYRVAKALVLMVRSAEGSRTETDLAVS